MELDEYQRIADASDSHWWYRSTRALLTQLIEPHLAPVTATTRYLDAAGGTGATGRWLADRALTVIDDYEPFALSIARTVSSGYRPVRADLNRIPHRDESFDAVLCVTALYHRLNPDPLAVVNEFVRVTKPGGLVCLMEPGVRRLRRSHDDVTHGARRFSLGDMRSLISESGLELLRSTGAYSFLVPPAAVLAVTSRGSGSSDVNRSEGGFSKALAVVASAERRLLRHASLPAGLSVLAIGRKPAR